MPPFHFTDFTAEQQITFRGAIASLAEVHAADVMIDKILTRHSSLSLSRRGLWTESIETERKRETHTDLVETSILTGGNFSKVTHSAMWGGYG